MEIRALLTLVCNNNTNKDLPNKVFIMGFIREILIQIRHLICRTMFNNHIHSLQEAPFKALQ